MSRKRKKYFQILHTFKFYPLSYFYFMSLLSQSSVTSKKKVFSLICVSTNSINRANIVLYGEPQNDLVKQYNVSIRETIFEYFIICADLYCPLGKRMITLNLKRKMNIDQKTGDKEKLSGGFFIFSFLLIYLK